MAKKTITNSKKLPDLNKPNKDLTVETDELISEITDLDYNMQGYKQAGCRRFIYNYFLDLATQWGFPNGATYCS